MTNHCTENRRLAKNTIVLYLRTIVTLAISLYISRVILEVLGIDNYGIYNIVGGFVSLFAIVSQTMVASTQRYMTFEIGKKEGEHSTKIFSTAFIIHCGLALILFVLFESIGLWFLNTHLNIYPDRLCAANWIYQFSILAFLLNILRSPFEAAIIAHERMKAFAYANILEATLKLAILYLILIADIDYLIQYGFYQLLLTAIMFTIYFFYSIKHFSEIRFVFVNEIQYYKEMISFAGLNFLGAGSTILSNQGINVLLNIFFGVTVNAARGIAQQVGVAISKFVNDFTTALNPQITKSYARGETDYTMKLVYKGSKFSFLLYLLFSLPIVIETPFILSLWLKNVPDFAVVFVRWTLITSLLNTWANPLTTCAFATGKIKNLSLWLGSIRLLTLPMVYVAFSFGMDPEYAYVVTFATDFILLFVRLSIVCKLVKISGLDFLKEVIARSLYVIVLSLSLIYMVHHLWNGLVSALFFRIVIIVVITAISVLILGFKASERKIIYSFILNRKHVCYESISKKNI